MRFWIHESTWSDKPCWYMLRTEDATNFWQVRGETYLCKSSKSWRQYNGGNAGNYIFKTRREAIQLLKQLEGPKTKFGSTDT